MPVPVKPHGYIPVEQCAKALELGDVIMFENNKKKSSAVATLTVFAQSVLPKSGFNIKNKDFMHAAVVINKEPVIIAHMTKDGYKIEKMNCSAYKYHNFQVFRTNLTVAGGLADKANLDKEATKLLAETNDKKILDPVEDKKLIEKLKAKGLCSTRKVLNKNTGKMEEVTSIFTTKKGAKPYSVVDVALATFKSAFNISSKLEQKKGPLANKENEDKRMKSGAMCAGFVYTALKEHAKSGLKNIDANTTADNILQLQDIRNRSGNVLPAKLANVLGKVGFRSLNVDQLGQMARQKVGAAPAPKA